MNLIVLPGAYDLSFQLVQLFIELQSKKSGTGTEGQPFSDARAGYYAVCKWREDQALSTIGRLDFVFVHLQTRQQK